VWAELFERSREDVLEAQLEIAKEAAEKILAALATP
jgi:TolB-like protein